MSVSSWRTTASAPGGSGAPVMIRTAVPAATAAAVGTPAANSPTTVNGTGREPVAPTRSAARTA